MLVLNISSGSDLVFQAVTRQVSSAQWSLTSVFGMGTGGPSPQSTPTDFVCLSHRQLNQYITLFRICQHFFLKK